MKSSLLLLIFLLLIVLSKTYTSTPITDYRINKKITITQFETKNYVNCDEPFSVNISIQKNRRIPIDIYVRFDLLVGLLNTIQKNIGELNYSFSWGKKQLNETIACTIRKGDYNWYQSKYNIQATLFIVFPRLNMRFPKERSTVRGVQIWSKFLEKEKVKILDVNVTDTIKETENKFNVTITVKNEGRFDFDIGARVDLIEKPAVVPGIEEYVNVKALTPERITLGETDNYNILLKKRDEHQLIIDCTLREVEQRKQTITIEAVLFVNIEGVRHQTDSSTLYKIFHHQPLCRDESCIYLVLAGVFGGLILIVLIAVIVRIIYPMYRIKKIKIREEKIHMERRYNP